MELRVDILFTSSFTSSSSSSHYTRTQFTRRTNLGVFINAALLPGLPLVDLGAIKTGFDS